MSNDQNRPFLPLALNIKTFVGLCYTTVCFGRERIASCSPKDDSLKTIQTSCRISFQSFLHNDSITIYLLASYPCDSAWHFSERLVSITILNSSNWHKVPLIDHEQCPTVLRLHDQRVDKPGITLPQWMDLFPSPSRNMCLQQALTPKDSSFLAPTWA